MEIKNPNFNRFIYGSFHYLKYIGYLFIEDRLVFKIWLLIGFIDLNITLFFQIVSLNYSEDMPDISAVISYINYYLVGNGKLIFMWFNRRALRKLITEMAAIYPSEKDEKNFLLGGYLKQIQMITTFLSTCCQWIVFIYSILPLMMSLVEYFRDGIYVFRTPLIFNYPFDLSQNWTAYILMYISQVHSSYIVAFSILGSDLCLFSNVLQLCMHFDLLSQKILKLQPKHDSNEENILKPLIDYHAIVLRLSKETSRIFTPSILFSLLSSSFIICFGAFQMVGDVPLIFIVKAFLLLLYEMKQVILTCYLGDQLMFAGGVVSTALYTHPWYEGSTAYKKSVHFMILRSQRSSALNIAGISVSLQTLRQVMSNSYRFFAFLKSSR